MRPFPRILVTIAGLLIFTTSPVQALPKSYSVTDSYNRHNLSLSGPGTPGITQSLSEVRICIFCHTPHHASNVTPLWSRDLSEGPYTPYDSTTLRAASKPGQPTGASRLCLSCHDGTIALGMLTRNHQIAELPQLPADRRSNLGTDLSDDHPISFPYVSSLTPSSELNQPSALPPAILLEQGNLECTACHDPHRDIYPPADQPTLSGMFLVLDNNTGSALCVACHKVTGWDTAAHALPNDACGNCHMPHKADQPARLLRGRNSDVSMNAQATCLTNCHNGAAPLETFGANVAATFTTDKAHQPGNVNMTGTHDANENPLNFKANSPHVECVDCHNPHQARHEVDPLAVAPQIRGLVGLEGVTIEKQADNTRIYATREYEICFKCHSENYFTPPAIPRQFPMNGTGDEKLRFDLNNPSFHPVTNSVALSSIPVSYSLRPSIPTNSQIYCSNCHAPHGTDGNPLKKHLLKAEYYTELAKPAAFIESDYQLCFICHDQNKLWLTGSEQPFPQHTLHVQDKLIPCSVCHDPHGVISTNAHLINFDLRTVSPITPVPSYRSTGVTRGCTVSCHTTGSPDPFTHTY